MPMKFMDVFNANALDGLLGQTNQRVEETYLDSVDK
jgi:hypothetical protein